MDTDVDYTSKSYILPTVFFLLLFTTLSCKTPIMYFEWRWQSDFGVSITVSILVTTIKRRPCWLNLLCKNHRPPKLTLRRWNRWYRVASDRWDVVWEIRCLWTINIVIFYLLINKLNKEDLSLMHFCAFRCEFIDLVDFLALLLYPLSNSSRITYNSLGVITNASTVIGGEATECTEQWRLKN